MLTFYNEHGEGFGAQVEFTIKNAVNGERSVSGTIISNDIVLSKIDIGWKFELNGEFFTIIYAKPRDEGRNLSVSFDAVHQFFYDFDHSNCYTEFNGSHRFEVYIEAIFKNSGYRYQIEPSVRVNSIRKENFGNAKRLGMFKDIIKAAGLEFSVSGKVVLITKKIGADLSTVVRKNFNMNELVIEKNINKFITYKRGLGAWKDEEDHSKGRYTSEYESPLASIYGRIEGEPVRDERYKDTGKLLERLKFEVDNSYSISVQLDMEDLTRAGYQYTQPRAGDYIMAINETIGFREKIRIVSFESSYDVTGRLINHKVTCNDIGSVQKQISSEGSIIRSVGQSKEYAESALAVATKALASADGKSTVYYGATKPKDEPIGTIRRGDILYLTAGEDTEMYIWNGSEWELKKLKLDTADLEKEFDKVKKATEQASEENKRRTDEALKKAGTSEDLAKEAKKIADDNVRNLNAFKTSAQKERENLSDELKRYSREETESQITAIRETISRDFVAKNTFTETVEGTRQRFEALTRENETKLAEYKQGIDGRIADITNQVAGKVNEVDFQRVRETAQLYERILGTNDSNVSTNIARMALTSDLFNVEVGKKFSNLTNLFYAPTKIPKYISSVATDKHLERVSFGDHDGIRINYTDSMSGWLGVMFPLTKKFVKQGEGLGYRIEIVVDKVPKNGRVLIQLLDNTAKAGMYYNSQIKLTKTGNQVFTGYLDIPRTGELHEYALRITLDSPGNIVIHKPMIIDKRIIPEEFVDSTDYNGEYTRTAMSILKDSFAFKTLNSNGDVLSALNLATGGASLEVGKNKLVVTPETTYIADGTIKSAMIGKAQIGTAQIGEIDASQARIINISAKNIIMDSAMANKMVSSDIFTDSLAAKTAFINKLRSVVVSATLLEGYKGRIGGFQIGTHDKDPSVYWLTGQNQFDVGMSNGSSGWNQTSLWVNWGDNWNKAGDYAWFVKRTGEMFCYNKAQFWNTPVIHGNLKVTGYIFYDNRQSGGKSGHWVTSGKYSNIEPSGGSLYLYYQGGGYDWIPMNKDVSDRRYKTNIEDSKVSALEVIKNLKTYSYRKEYDDKIEDISCGIMAQDIQKYAPEAFFENPDGAYSYNTFALVPYLIKAIQELNQKIKKLEKTA